MEVGWRAFERNGFKDLVARRYREGATLLGVSAGAVQMGRGGLTDDGSAFLPTFGFLPSYVGVHEQDADWPSLRRTLSRQPKPAQGIGIPAGGAATYSAGQLRPIRKPLFEICLDGPIIRERILCPAP